MRVETSARELALKALYQRDLMSDRPLQELRRFCNGHAGPDASRLAMELVEGCLEHRERIDEVIRRTAQNWKLDRMAATDRNILRLGVFELLFRDDTPPKVAINEAIELAKKFSTENSPTFVNGVLDRIYSNHVEGTNGGEPGGAAGEEERPTRLMPDLRPDPEARVDLHVHSTASDGSEEPEDLPAMAAEAGLAAFALTDHDSVQGLPAATKAAEAAGVRLIPGVELTGYEAAGDGQREVHVAGLFVDPDSEVLKERLRQLRHERVGRVREMARRLEELGAPIDADAVLARAHGGAVGRVHVAQEMVERGHCADIREAFNRFIAEDGPAYVPKKRISPAQAVQIVQAAGGVSVLCHPGLEPQLEESLARMVEDGLDALEVHYPRHDARTEKRLLELAEEYGLAVTGGSDFHGRAKPDIRIGQEFVSYVELFELQKKALERA
ncbi:MAG: transcription antitermination factor NusB [Planctomycetota bacterium]